MPGPYISSRVHTNEPLGSEDFLGTPVASWTKLSGSGRQDRMGTSLCYDSNSSRLRSEVSAKHIKYVLPFLFVMDHVDAKPLMFTLLLPALRTQWFTMLPYMHAPEVLGVHGGGFGKDQESFQDQETHKWLHIH